MNGSFVLDLAKLPLNAGSFGTELYDSKSCDLDQKGMRVA